ncbi:hypothetical protein ACOMHN_014750 [Nucella lapillus]
MPRRVLGASPAELSCGRKFRTTLPVLPKTIIPHPIDPASVHARDILGKQRQKHAFDAHHGVQPLRELHPGEKIVVKLDDEKGWKLPGVVVHQHASQSYIIQTPRGRLRRNRRHLWPDTTIDEQMTEPLRAQRQMTEPLRAQQTPPLRTDRHTCEGLEPVSTWPTGGQPGPLSRQLCRDLIRGLQDPRHQQPLHPCRHYRERKVLRLFSRRHLVE